MTGLLLLAFLLGTLLGIFVGCLLAARYEQQREAERIEVRRRYGQVA